MNNNKIKEYKLSKADKTAVFIDAANLERSVYDLGTLPPNIKKFKRGFYWKALPKGFFQVDYKRLRQFFQENVNLVSLNFYSANFGTESHNNFLAFLKRKGFRLKTKNIKDIQNLKATITRRCRFCKETNEVDIKFKCVKCGKENDVPIERKANFDVEISVDAVNELKNFDTFVLFSGDSDFAYLLKFLKQNKKQTVVISERGHVSKELIDEADSYFDLHVFKGKFIIPKRQKSRP